MRLLCWNINSLIPSLRNIKLKHESLCGYFQHHNVDVVCLQETKVPDSKLTKEVVCVDGYESFWAISRERQGYSGVTTWVVDPFSPVEAAADHLGGGHADIDREGRVVMTDHGSFVLFNVYVPNAGDRPARSRLSYKLRFLEALKGEMDKWRARSREILVVGDFNIAAHPRDLHPSLNLEVVYSGEEVQVMRGLISEYPDVWRTLHPDKEGCYTVWDEKTSARAFNVGLRIDYVLCTPGLLPQISLCEILDTPPKWSDHAAIILEVQNLALPPKHPPCALSSRKMKRFHDPSQRSIAAMFGAAKLKPKEPNKEVQDSEPKGREVDMAQPQPDDRAPLSSPSYVPFVEGLSSPSQGAPTHPVGPQLPSPDTRPAELVRNLDSGLSHATAANSPGVCGPDDCHVHDGQEGLQQEGTGRMLSLKEGDPPCKRHRGAGQEGEVGM